MTTTLWACAITPLHHQYLQATAQSLPWLHQDIPTWGSGRSPVVPHSFPFARLPPSRWPSAAGENLSCSPHRQSVRHSTSSSSSQRSIRWASASDWRASCSRSKASPMSMKACRVDSTTWARHMRDHFTHFRNHLFTLAATDARGATKPCSLVCNRSCTLPR